MDYFNIEKVDLIKTVQYQNSCSNELEIRTLELRNDFTGFCLLILRQILRTERTSGNIRLN